jgi:dephospho-CoA kinase
VDADPETQVARLVARDGLSEEAALSRLAAQASREERRAAADVVLANQGSVTDLQSQIARLWPELNEPDAGN